MLPWKGLVAREVVGRGGVVVLIDFNGGAKSICQ